jgi:hypothetical protein
MDVIVTQKYGSSFDKRRDMESEQSRLNYTHPADSFQEPK